MPGPGSRRDEDQPEGAQGNVEADQQFAEDEQHAQTLGGDGTGHGAEDAHRGEAHDVVGDLEHDVDHFLHGTHQATRRLVVQVAQGDAEEDGEDEDLQDLVGGHGLEDVLRKTWVMKSLRLSALVFRLVLAAASGRGTLRAVPGWSRLAKSSPRSREQKEAQTNQPRALPPMRPTVLVSPMPARPATRVAKTRGAMIILIRRRKMSVRMLK